MRIKGKYIMKAVQDRMILEKCSGEERSPSGLITLTTSQKKGKVLAASLYCIQEGVEIGDEVFYTKGDDITVDGKPVIVVAMEDVLVAVSPKPHLKVV